MGASVSFRKFRFSFQRPNSDSIVQGLKVETLREADRESTLSRLTDSPSEPRTGQDDFHKAVCRDHHIDLESG